MIQNRVMVALCAGAPEVLELQERPRSLPGRGEVALRVRLTGVNWADIAARRSLKQPQVLGLDACGEITALGEGVEGFRVGQRVAAFTPHGSYAAEVVSPVQQVFALPDMLPDEGGASLVTLVTAYNVLHWAARVQAGETVLIHAAAGGVGTLAVQFALQAGARVLGVVGSDERAAWVRSLGAEAINRRTSDWAEAARVLTDGAGPDVILDSISGETLEQGVKLLAPFGRLVACGQAGGRAAQIDTSLLHRQNRAVIGYSSGHYRAQRPAALRETVGKVFALWQDGKIRLPPARIFPLEQAAQAHAWVESGEGVGRAFLQP